ncbi:DeoR family transcriptional regulator [Blautia sp. MCC289]|nr:DeoR family transcriptional regulator [Blautia sp. MCC289]
MLTEKRYEVILNLLNEKNSVTVTEIKELLGISESTIRRDLAAFDKAGKLIKVFGGAVAADGGFTTAEPSVAQKAEINKDEKTAIARYAASLIERDDFVYLDAGTTTGQMIDFIKEKSATFVTNAVSHAQRLAAQGYRVYLIGGELKGTTEAVVGNQAILSLQKLHFSKAFLGTNGVGLKAGFSTPDYSEALVKQTAVEQARQVFVLADYSKFGNVSSVTFASLERGVILTDRRPPESFGAVKNIKIVGAINSETDEPWLLT